MLRCFFQVGQRNIHCCAEFPTARENLTGSHTTPTVAFFCASSYHFILFSLSRQFFLNFSHQQSLRCFLGMWEETFKPYVQRRDSWHSEDTRQTHKSISSYKWGWLYTASVVVWRSTDFTIGQIINGSDNGRLCYRIEFCFTFYARVWNVNMYLNRCD